MGKTPLEIASLDISRDVKNEILPRFISIKSHETYFSSFASVPTPCPLLKKHFSSAASFRFDLLCAAREADCEFLFVFVERSRPVIRFSRDTRGAFLTREPVLALDLSEHAYFLDYRFNREEYLRRAIEHLDLQRLLQYLK